MKITQTVRTVADLRRFLRLIDLHDDVPEHSELRGRTRASFAPEGGIVRDLTVRVPDPDPDHDPVEDVPGVSV